MVELKRHAVQREQNKQQQQEEEEEEAATQQHHARHSGSSSSSSRKPQEHKGVDYFQTNNKNNNKCYNNNNNSNKNNNKIMNNERNNFKNVFCHTKHKNLQNYKTKLKNSNAIIATTTTTATTTPITTTTMTGSEFKVVVVETTKNVLKKPISTKRLTNATQTQPTTKATAKIRRSKNIISLTQKHNDGSTLVTSCHRDGNDERRQCCAAVEEDDEDEEEVQESKNLFNINTMATTTTTTTTIAAITTPVKLIQFEYLSSNCNYDHSNNNNNNTTATNNNDNNNNNNSNKNNNEHYKWLATARTPTTTTAAAANANENEHVDEEEEEDEKNRNKIDGHQIVNLMRFSDANDDDDDVDANNGNAVAETQKVKNNSRLTATMCPQIATRATATATPTIPTSPMATSTAASASATDNKSDQRKLQQQQKQQQQEHTIAQNSQNISTRTIIRTRTSSSTSININTKTDNQIHANANDNANANANTNASIRMTKGNAINAICGQATCNEQSRRSRKCNAYSRMPMFMFALLLVLICATLPGTRALRLTNNGNSLGKGSSGNKEQLNIGLIAPHTNFGKREYLRAINNAVTGLTKTRGAKLTFLKDYSFEQKNIHFDMMSLTPSPTAILSTLCKEFLHVNVSAILYMMNNEQFGHSTASAQYFLQLAGYLGIPVISWNADNSGLERRASQSTLQLQLAPSIEHQSAAMLSILERYKWHQFSVVTSQIAGHDDFVQAVRERVAEMQEHFKFTILNSIVVTRTSDLMELVNSEARVMLLYATQTEAITILRAAEEMKLTGENYVWVVSQSVIEKKDAHPQFPVGMLGVHFDTSSAALMNEISNAIKIYSYGVEAYLTDPINRGRRLTTQSLSCEDEGRGRWDNGETFFKYLRNVSIEGDLNKPNIEFTADGDPKSAELKIMNLRPSANNKNHVWEEIGVWKSWETQKLDIRDIAWPGNSHAPPQGVPEKFHLKITFLEEAPYINLSPADPVSGKCLMDRGVLCRVAADHEMAADIDVGQAHRNGSFYQCCSGFCIDLLEKFAEELGFTYELVRVEDGKWGTLENGKWNGLIADLVNRKTDMVLTSLMINTEREAVVDFSEPFMETGIAIVVAKRTGIISPTAFLEPFDTASWMLVGIVAIQAATFMIFLFEWLSPSGYDMKLYLQNTNVTPYRFSLFRTYWLVWAVLFQAAVHVDSPRGFTSRFMTNVWALFAVVFLAIYTANLAAFMITREEFHEFSGLNDSRLVHPYSQKPSFKFGTIPYSHTDSTIHKYFKDMHYYMKQYNKTSVADGVAAVLNGNLDSFIYDGTVLDYLVAQDEDCRLMTVGSWYAMTGYGLAFSRNSKYVQMFNKRLLEFRANGDLERLRRYWMTGTCRPGKQEHKSSDPLALEQFLSAFLLLMAGILLAALLLLLEHVYFKYIRKRLAKKDGGHCCALISLSMGKSLTFRGAVYEATEILKKHRCNDPICDTHLWKVKHELDMSRLRVRQLEKVMEKHGIKAPQLRLASSSDLLNHHLKERPPLLGNLSLAASAQDLYRWSYKTEIAEMETVL